jgi:hypothetical protein
MPRRIAVAILWFGMVALAHEVLWSITGSPRLLGLVLGVIVAGFTWVDPTRQLHPPRHREGLSPARLALAAKSTLAPH